LASWNFEHALLLSVPFMLLQFSAYASPLVYIHAGNLSDKCQHKRYHKANAFTVNDAVRIVVANIGLGNCSRAAVTIYSSQLDPCRCTARVMLPRRNRKACGADGEHTASTVGVCAAPAPSRIGVPRLLRCPSWCQTKCHESKFTTHPRFS
jgi:hypothetical protein